MTDRKPKGSTPVAPQRPKSAQSASANGTSSRTATQGDSSSTQAMPAVKNDKSSGSAQKASSGPAPTSGQNAAPATKQRPQSAPKTAGEIAAESGPNARPAPTPAQQPSTPQSAPAPLADSAAARTARLRLARVDPWSVMKVSFALSIALAIVTVIAITIVWFVLGAAGVWDAVNSSVASLLSDDAESFDITEYVGYGRVVGFALLVSAVDVVLITAIATLGAFLYNLAASLLGGLELTLAEDT